MDFSTLVRSIAVFLILAVTLGLNIDDNLVARVGMAGNYGLIIGLSFLFTLVLVGRNVYVVGVVVVLSLLANMPADFSLNFGIDRDYYAGAMMALVFQPLVTRLID